MALLSAVPSGIPRSAVPAGGALRALQSAAPKRKLARGTTDISGADPTAVDPITMDIPELNTPAVPVSYRHYTPAELKSQLFADPSFQAAQSAYQANVDMARSSLRSAIRAAAIQSGYDIGTNAPQDLWDYVGDIDPATRAAAAANQMSDKAQLQRALEGGLNTVPYALAARGGGRSGGAATAASALNQQYQTEAYNRTQAVINAIRGGIGSFQTQKAGELNNLNSAMAAVAAYLAGQNQPVGGTAEQPYHPGLGGPYPGSTGSVSTGYGGLPIYYPGTAVPHPGHPVAV